jgi:hypothetical protein
MSITVLSSLGKIDSARAWNRVLRVCVVLAGFAEVAPVVDQLIRACQRDPARDNCMAIIADVESIGAATNHVSGPLPSLLRQNVASVSRTTCSLCRQ